MTQTTAPGSTYNELETAISTLSDRLAGIEKFLADRPQPVSVEAVLEGEPTTILAAFRFGVAKLLRSRTVQLGIASFVAMLVGKLGFAATTEAVLIHVSPLLIALAGVVASDTFGKGKAEAMGRAAALPLPPT